MSKKRRGDQEIVRKLRDADAMLAAGKDLASVSQVSEATLHRWRNQYGGMKSEAAEAVGGRECSPQEAGRGAGA